MDLRLTANVKQQKVRDDKLAEEKAMLESAIQDVKYKAQAVNFENKKTLSKVQKEVLKAKMAL